MELFSSYFFKGAIKQMPRFLEVIKNFDFDQSNLFLDCIFRYLTDV